MLVPTQHLPNDAGYGRGCVDLLCHDATRECFWWRQVRLVLYIPDFWLSSTVHVPDYIQNNQRTCKTGGNTKKIPLKRSIPALLRNKYWIMIVPLCLVGYIGTQEQQSTAALSTIKFMYLYSPIIFGLLSALILVFYI